MSINTISVTTDNDKHLILFRLRGDVSGQTLVDKALSAYAGLETPWVYNRLFDLRHFGGFLEFSVLEQMAKDWAEVGCGHNDLTRTAVVNNDPLSPARLKTYQHLFPNVETRTFTDLDEALDWIDS